MPGPVLQLARPRPRPAAAPVLDDDQRSVVAHRGGPLRVLAGPGTGKTTTLVETVVDRVDRDGLAPDAVLVLTFSRRAAAELRERISARLGRTVREPVARTFHSYAFGLLRAEAVRAGEPAPRLLTGPEQDAVIRDLLLGDVAEFGAASWPPALHAALSTQGFADELRDLLMRAEERGVTPKALAAAGRAAGRADWVAVARFARQYRQVLALREAGQAYDPAVLVGAAARRLELDAGLLRSERDARALVVVDEYQDADPAQERLLQLLAGDGRELVVVGDPHQSIYAFRGSDPQVLLGFPDRFRSVGGGEAPTIRLRRTRRFGPALSAAAARVAGRLGGPGGRPLGSTEGDADCPLEVALLPSVAQEAALVAHRLRVAHLRRGVPWSQMAVLVRSGAQLPVLRRALGAAGVPVAVRREEIPLVDEPVVQALLDVLDVAAGRLVVDAPTATDLLTGPLGAADPLALRRLRQELAVLDRAAGGEQPSGELLLAALEHPERLDALAADEVGDQVAEPARRLAAVLAAARAAAAEPVATAESVLWAAWVAADLEPRWSAVALSGGPGAAAADRDLDAAVALFEAAGRYVDRLPGASLWQFLDHVRDQQIPADSLAARAPLGEAVTLLTAHAAKGLEWQVVAVSGVQEGVWPDLRLRGSLLGTADLLDRISGRQPQPVEQMTAQLAEERRLFYVAITRARRELLVTAVSGEELSPSRFLDELDPPTGSGRFTDDGDRRVGTAPRGLDLGSLVAELRRVVVDGDEGGEPGETAQAAAAAELARLAAAGVDGAHPDQWYGLPPLSDDSPLRAPDEPVPVSPSRVDGFRKCGLRWLLEQAGASAGDTPSQAVGSLVHRLAQEAADDDLRGAALLDRFDELWPTLELGTGWVGARAHARARAMVERLVRWLDANPRDLVGVELPFRAELGRAVVQGRVDRLERDEAGRLVVVDLKTGASAVPKDKLAEHPQLGTYQAAVEAGAFAAQAGGSASSVSGGAELVQLGRATRQLTVQVQQSPAESDDPGWAARLLADVAAGMAAATFAAVEGEHCGYCPVRTSCPVWPEGQQVTA